MKKIIVIFLMLSAFIMFRAVSCSSDAPDRQAQYKERLEKIKNGNG